jgi:hypothetical protein
MPVTGWMLRRLVRGLACGCALLAGLSAESRSQSASVGEAIYRQGVLRRVHFTGPTGAAIAVDGDWITF